MSRARVAELDQTFIFVPVPHMGSASRCSHIVLGACSSFFYLFVTCIRVYISHSVDAQLPSIMRRRLLTLAFSDLSSLTLGGTEKKRCAQKSERDSS